MKNNIENIIIYLIIAIAMVASIFLISEYHSIGFYAVLALTMGALAFYFILKDPFVGLSLTIATLPFERIPTVDIGLFTLKIDQVFAGMTLFSFLLKLFFERKKIHPFPIGWTIIMYLLVSLISMCYAVDISRAVSVYIFVFFMILISFVTTNLVDSTERLTKIIHIILWTAFFVTLFGIYQFFGDLIGLPNSLTGLRDVYSKAIMGFPRIQAFSMEPLFLANYLFIPLGIAVGAYIFKEKQIMSQTKLLILILLILLIIILGISRGAYIALGAFALFFVIFMARKVITIKNVLILVLGALIIGSITYGFLKIAMPDALERFISHAKIEDFSTGESVQKRLADYQKAIGFWQESPLIGIGPGNYGPKYVNYPPHDQVAGWEVVNNQYLETLAETGILGLFFLLITFLVVFWRTAKAYFRTKSNLLKSVLIGLIAAFIAILVQYNFFSTLYIMHIWILIGLIVAVQNLCFKENSKEG